MICYAGEALYKDVPSDNKEYNLITHDVSAALPESRVLHLKGAYVPAECICESPSLSAHAHVGPHKHIQKSGGRGLQRAASGEPLLETAH